MIKNILFDLDGTLLPLDMDEFIACYFGELCKKLAPHGYEPNALMKGIWAGTAAMQKNDGSMSNEARFWQVFCSLLGENARADEPVFEDFYKNEFNLAQKICGFNPKSRELVELCKAKGLRTVLATSPLFPKIATYARASWAGLDVNAFELVTTYENCTTCKPNPAYYLEICEKCGFDPAECLMVGNDAEEDTAAASIGMQVYLVTDCLYNKKERDISPFLHGSMDELVEFVSNM